MSFFACALQLDAGTVSQSFRAQIEEARRRRTMPLTWYHAFGFAAAVDRNEGAFGAGVARAGPAIAVGVVRVDNRVEVARFLGCDDRMDDIELAMRLVLLDGGARIDRLLGDFAFVVWDPANRRLVAARDAFGVRTLYHTDPRSALVAFCSHAEPLATSDRYDERYLVGRLASQRPNPELTVYAGVSAVPPASVFRLRAGRSDVTTYWTAADAQAKKRPLGSPREQSDEFRALLVESVRQRLGGEGCTWSNLSGGLDSSSVVSVAQWLEQTGRVSHGLAGTVSFTDAMGTGADEREYSDAVVRQFGVRNELVPHLAREVLALRPYRPDQTESIPLLDQPDRPYSAVLRDYAAACVVRDAGGRILLTGQGGDSLVAGSMLFFADWAVTGRMWQAVREMAHRAALGRVSVWSLAYGNVVMPLLSASVRRAMGLDKEAVVPPWIRPEVLRRYAGASRSEHDEFYGGPMGRKYAHALAATIASIPASLPQGPLEDALDVRHPFLHRPLVELALHLEPEMCVRPHARKWVLREAMRGILPEVVRTRVGKGSLDGLNVVKMLDEGRRMERLANHSILAELGCIDPVTLRGAIQRLLHSRVDDPVLRDHVSTTVQLELWLQMRSGRWTAEDSQAVRTHHREMA